MITSGVEISVALPTYHLGIKRFEQLRRAIDNIARRYQREALEDKLLVAYTNLLHAVVPADFPLRTKKIRPGAIYELVKIGGERSNLSRSDRQAAMSIIKKEKEEIAKTDSDALLALRADIEKVTLGTLIQKFEDMLTKNLTEPTWQEFLKANPFILSLAFAYPVLLIQDQAYVGGATIRGAGEKIADFLLAQRYTGNLALIEIKRPKTPLLKAVPYRADLHAPTTEVSGSVSQVLDQKYRLQNSFTQKAYESGLMNVHPYSIQCIVIVGTSPTGKDERKSLELFRNSTKDVTVVTFDELLEKLKEIQRVFSASDETAPAMTDADVPFLACRTLASEMAALLIMTPMMIAGRASSPLLRAGVRPVPGRTVRCDVAIKPAVMRPVLRIAGVAPAAFLALSSKKGLVVSRPDPA